MTFTKRFEIFQNAERKRLFFNCNFIRVKYITERAPVERQNICVQGGASGMTLQTISNAALLALASTIFVLLFLKSFRIISQPFAPSRSFSHSIMVEAAQRLRDELDRPPGPPLRRR